jgi:hypothetical protein
MSCAAKTYLPVPSIGGWIDHTAGLESAGKHCRIGDLIYIYMNPSYFGARPIQTVISRGLHVQVKPQSPRYTAGSAAYLALYRLSQSMPLLTPTFNALLREAQFTKEMLGTGATQIRSANYASKGIYFQAFTSLSTGLERIGKLCLMLDRFIESGGTFPRPKEMYQVGHKLELLYARSQEIVRKRSIQLHLTPDLSDPVHLAIVRVLHNFAEGDRYSNIDVLVGDSSSPDPIGKWFDEVDIPLYNSRVSQRKKDEIARNARIGAQLMGTFSMVLHTAETGEEIRDFEDGSRRTGIWKAVAPHRQLAVLQVVRYWAELIGELGYSAQALPGEHIPHFGEVFAMFYNDDSYLKSRKTWEKL